MLHPDQGQGPPSIHNSCKRRPELTATHNSTQQEIAISRWNVSLSYSITCFTPTAAPAALTSCALVVRARTSADGAPSKACPMQRALSEEMQHWSISIWFSRQASSRRWSASASAPTKPNAPARSPSQQVGEHKECPLCSEDGALGVERAAGR